jgi:hypothetical protein
VLSGSEKSSSRKKYTFINSQVKYNIMFSRKVSRTLLRRSLSLNTAARANHATTLRCFGAAARKPSVEEQTTESADMIRDYIKGLMEKEQDEEVVLKPISDEDLEQSLEQFQVREEDVCSPLASWKPPPISPC